MDGGTEHVALGLLVRSGRVLLARRTPSRRWSPGLWDAPGGHLLPGEDPAAGLRRELREELAVRVDVDPAPDLALRWPEWALDVWVVRRWTGAPVNAAPHEHDELAWTDLAGVRAAGARGELAGEHVVAAARLALR